MIFLRLLGLGAAYGVGFALIKTMFPTPIILMPLVEGSSSEGNLTLLTLVYMGVGLLSGLVATPIFGGLLLLRRRRASARVDAAENSASFGSRLTLSLLLAMFMGVLSGLMIMLAYATGILQSGGVLDPLALIRSSNFAPGTPMLVAWTIARDLLPAGLTGLFLSPLGGGLLLKLYTSRDASNPKAAYYDEDF